MRVFLMDRKLNVSEAYLRPGFAFGGSCLPKDVRALLYAARAADLSLPLLSSILPSNEAQVRRGVEAVLATRRRRVGVVGLAFKAGHRRPAREPDGDAGRDAHRQGLRRAHPRPQRLDRPAVGANRRYIEEEIPHIASLMCDERGGAARPRRGARDRQPRARRRRARSAAARPDQIVIDLTRGAARARPGAPAAS